MTSVSIPTLLLQAIERGRCVLFLGAGVSYEAGVPTASELAKMLADEAGYPESFPLDLIKVSEYYQVLFGRAQLVNKLREAVEGAIVPSATHMLIATLRKFNSIITTNYDDLLERAHAEIGRPIYVVRHPADLPMVPIGSNVPTLLKIHGDLSSPENIVITEDDYYHYLDSSLKSTLGAVLRAQLATGTFLFVGYSLRDYNFFSLFESVRKELSDYMPRGFAAVPSPDLVEARFWLKRGIELIDATAKVLFEQISHALITPGPTRVFLSYSFRDHRLAKEIQMGLGRRGIITSSPSDFRLGENIAERITEDILRSRAFIILLSSESVRSPWIARELQIAQSLRQGKIFPVLLEECNIPESLRDIKYVDARQELSSVISELALRIGEIQSDVDSGEVS